MSTYKAKIASPHRLWPIIGAQPVPELAEKIKIFDPVSRHFAGDVVNDCGQLPSATQKFIAANITNLSIAQHTTWARPDLAEVVIEATKDDARTHYNHSSGLYDSGTREVIVSEFYLRCDADGLKHSQKPAIDIPPHWKINYYRMETARHEIGHAIDAALDWMSNSRSFRECWELDIQNMGGRQAARKKGFGYYIQDGVKGRRETFTENWAEAHEGGIRNNVHTTFHQCWRWMQGFVDDFAYASRNGIQAMHELTTEYRKAGNVTLKHARREMKRLANDSTFARVRDQDFFHAGTNLCERLIKTGTISGHHLAYGVAQEFPNIAFTNLPDGARLLDNSVGLFESLHDSGLDANGTFAALLRECFRLKLDYITTRHGAVINPRLES